MLGGSLDDELNPCFLLGCTHGVYLRNFDQLWYTPWSLTPQCGCTHRVFLRNVEQLWYTPWNLTPQCKWHRRFRLSSVMPYPSKITFFCKNYNSFFLSCFLVKNLESWVPRILTCTVHIGTHSQQLIKVNLPAVNKDTSSQPLIKV